MTKNNHSSFYKAMKIAERESISADYMQYDNTVAYSTEDHDMISDDWDAVQNIFGTNDTVMERYAEGMVDGNICYGI